jgi:hypothetical protein
MMTETSSSQQEPVHVATEEVTDAKVAEAVGSAEPAAVEPSAGAEEPDQRAASRLKQIVVISLMVILLIATVFVVALNPPSGSQPVSRASEAQFSLGRKVMLLAPGNTEAAQLLRYAPFLEGMQPVRYKLYIQENNRYDKGNPVRTEFRADVIIRHGIPGNPRSIYISLDEKSVDIHVYDGETERVIADLGTMFNGIILESRLDSVSGMSRFVPNVEINPQIGRVLYILSDVLRYAWTGLPEQAVGVGGGWQVLDDTNEAAGETVRVIAALKPEFVEMKLEHLTRKMIDGEGNAMLRFLRKNAQDSYEGQYVGEFKGQLRTTLDHGAEGKGTHELAFSLRFGQWEVPKEG